MGIFDGTAPSGFALNDPRWRNSMAGGSDRVSRAPTQPAWMPSASSMYQPGTSGVSPALQMPPMGQTMPAPLLPQVPLTAPQPAATPWSPGQFMQRGEGFDIYDIPAIGPALGGLYEGITGLPEQLGLGALAQSPLGQNLKDFGQGAIEGYERYKGIGQQPRDFAAMIRGMSADERAELLGLLQGP